MEVLESTEFTTRFANRVFLQKEDDTPGFFIVLWTTETRFPLSKSVNIQNCCIWLRENLHALVKKNHFMS